MTETVHCDVGDLVNLPVTNSKIFDFLPDMIGVSEKQTNWAEVIRGDKLEEWEADLPDKVLEALCTITDATWWIAQKEADASEIKWPKAWTKQAIRPIGRNGPPPAQRPPPPPLPPKPVRQEHLNNFDQFARTMCKSPELGYLAIMAMAVRQNPNDATVRAKYDEVRGTIQGHLNAIDNIANGA